MCLSKETAKRNYREDPTQKTSGFQWLNAIALEKWEEKVIRMMMGPPLKNPNQLKGHFIKGNIISIRFFLLLYLPEIIFFLFFN